MNTHEIVQKLWNLCNVLRDDGITYHQYVTELTYILFLKMAKETSTERDIPEKYRWDKLAAQSGVNLKKFYKELLAHLGEEGKGRIQQIYSGAISNIEEPKNLEKIISSIDRLDWYNAKEEGLGNLYEGLLEKNAGEKKSGAGQYFTPRRLIDVMVELVDPKAGELCNDPACGTFGFMIAASEHVKRATNQHATISSKEGEFQVHKAFTGAELVHETHRLALMNAMLHDIQGEILLGDSLSEMGKKMTGYDVVLTNPPFGTKQGGERPTRDDFTFPSSNKQLNFLQHVYRSLKSNGKSRAAVIVPDNVLFQDGDGQQIRADLMDKCDLHTILRLPTGIFYAQGVKTNVLFFTRGKTDKGNTKEIWFYDLRTNMPSFGKTNQLNATHFEEFKKAYLAKDRSKIKDERWSVFSRAQIKNDSLDLGLIADDSLTSYEDLPDPVESAEEAIAKLEQAVDLLQQVVKELHVAGVGTNGEPSQPSSGKGL
jgi:type I restriction enzyme M protein